MCSEIELNLMDLLRRMDDHLERIEKELVKLNKK